MDQNGGKPRQAAPGIRSTVSYIIFLDHVLGQGATSKVYLGRNKKSGKRVACKVPHGPSLLRLGVDLDRESKVLLQLRHPNIVCLEAIEKDQISRENILYMELCTGGSLYDRLERPENSHGLEERVFLDVMRDITAGMKYLRDNGFVHRDVKPGNIMCFNDDHGKTIYKLADFGAARELTDDENFTSLHGTEEYLHPKVYEKAVLRKPVVAAFDARVDLWSIGATLYHIATGSLPFRPLGGRKNSSMMFHLTTKKPSGVISGVQTGPSDTEIIWSSELPETCQLSIGLQRLLTPMLAGLLEYNSSKNWSFTQFFNASQAISSKRALDVFWVCESSSIKVYLDPSETFGEFQELVASQTKLPANQQVFMLNGEPFRPDRRDKAGAFPVVSETNPIMMCNKEQIPRKCQIFPPLVAIMPVLHPRFSTQNDFPIAKGAVTVGYMIQHRQEKLHQMHLNFDQFARSERSNFEKGIIKLEPLDCEVKGSLSQVRREVENGKRFVETLSRRQPAEGEEAKGRGGDIGQYCQELKHQLDVTSQQLYQNERLYGEAASMQNELKTMVWVSWIPSQGCNLTDNACMTELVYLINQVEDILKRFTRDKKAGKLSYNDEQIHKMEKLNLGDLMKRITKCMKKCEDRWRNRHTELMVWYSESQSKRFLLNKVETILSSLVKKCADLKEDVADLTSRCWQLVETQLDVTPKSLPAATAKAMAMLLSASTQTSLPVEGLHYPPHASGLAYARTNIPMSSIAATSSSGQPVEMGAPLRMSPDLPPSHNVYMNTSNIYANDGDAFKRYGYREGYPPCTPARALSAPACGQSHYRVLDGQLQHLQHAPPGPPHPHHQACRSSPPELVARGLPNSASAYHHPIAMAPNGDTQWGGGSRMISVSKQLKQDIDYYKNQSSIPQLLKESSEVLNEIELAADLSLGDPELPPHNHDDDIFLPTLVPEGAEGGEEDFSLSLSDDVERLVIKRPPMSYDSMIE